MNNTEKAILMKEAKEKLKNLKIEGDVDDMINEFCKVLSDRLNETLVPQGFVMASELALYDLREGKDGFTGLPIRSRLVGYPSFIYTIIRMRIPDIAKEIFPEEFSKEVEKFMNDVNGVMRKEE